MLPKFSRVMLVTDQYESEGGRRGMLGYIIEDYGNGNYEVEFSDANGTTVAQFVAQENQLLLSPEVN